MITWVMIYWISMYGSITISDIASETECKRVAIETARFFNSRYSEEDLKDTAENRSVCFSYEKN